LKAEARESIEIQKETSGSKIKYQQDDRGTKLSGVLKEKGT
jgi:hypothetical protein